MSPLSAVALEPGLQTCDCGHVLAGSPKSCPECNAAKASAAGAARSRLPPAEEPAAEVGAPGASGAADTIPTDRRKAARAAKQAESQAALRSLEAGIVDARRRTISTLIGFSAVAAVGIAAFGLAGQRGGALALAVAPLVLMVCCLCWRRERALTRGEYLSLPHSQGRNGRLRCIHCGTLGDPAHNVRTTVDLRPDCPKCRAALFRRG